MSRYDQENVDHLDLPDPVVTQAKYYTVEAIEIPREEYDKIEQRSQPRICAKAITHNEYEDSVVTTYFVLCDSSGQLFDPRSTDVRYSNRNVWKFRRTSRTCFDVYLKFLKFKYTSLLRQAQRVL